jgi:hypothetical protein
MGGGNLYGSWCRVGGGVGAELGVGCPKTGRGAMRVCAASWELIGHHDRKPQKNSGKKMLPVKKFQEIFFQFKKNPENNTLLTVKI